MTDHSGAERPGHFRREALDFAKALGIAIPPFALAAWVITRGEPSAHAGIALMVALGLSALWACWVRSALSRRLRTVSSVLEAFREGDFSIRARTARGDSLLADVLFELNQLGDTLREHRLGELEAWALIRKVMAEVDVVVLAFDQERRMKLANDRAARVLGRPSTALLGQDANALGLAALLEGAVPRVVRDCAPLGAGPWELRRGAFRLSGEPHALVILSDVSGALREQEREAWKRLIRVMGHEINNSLAPIQSISQNLHRILDQSPRPAGWEEDLVSGLSVVERRSEALGRFMAAYAQLARLPPPKLGHVDVAPWVRRTASLEQRVLIEVIGGPDLSLLGDSDQLDQLLINLLKNAADAALETKGGVRVSWEVIDRMLELVIEDDGPGVADTANLFVPFFTTKSGGSGIGLVLARQIAEAHGGQASLASRLGHSGARAVVRLPVSARST